MFLNDPMLYGATFPYRDLPYRDLQTPVQSFLPWQNVPRFIPPFYGFQTPYFNYVNPWIHTAFTPPFHQVPQFNVPQFNVPQFNLPQMNVPPMNVPQMNVPQMNIPQMNIPQMNIPQMNIPLTNWTRPLCY